MYGKDRGNFPGDSPVGNNVRRYLLKLSPHIIEYIITLIIIICPE